MLTLSSERSTRSGPRWGKSVDTQGAASRRTATAGPPDGEPRRPQRRDIVSHRGGGARPSRTSPSRSAGITAVLLLHEGVPELAAEPASLHCSPSPTNTGRETLDVLPWACTGSITAAPTTCSTVSPSGRPGAGCVLSTDSYRVWPRHQQRPCCGGAPGCCNRRVSSSSRSDGFCTHSELFSPSSRQRITRNVPVYRLNALAFFHGCSCRWR
jgi:hypothetical protein